MSELRIRNWDKWQSYRKDRGQPPWIKIHRQLMRDPSWVDLSDAQRGQLVAIWMLAADRDGVIPASPQVIRKLCFLDTDPDLQLFADKGFIDVSPDGCQRDANPTPTRRQDDAPEKSREEEIREEKKEDTADAVSLSEIVFEAPPIRLTKKHFDQWQDAFSNLDLKAELISLQDWAAKQPKWFPAVSGALAKRNREIRKVRDAPQLDANLSFYGPNKSRWGIV